MTHCKCCDLERAIFSPRRTFNDVPAALIVCDLCARHQGSDVHALRKREQIHLEMWRADRDEQLEELTAATEARIAKLKAVIDEKETELRERPVRIVVENEDLDRLRDAEELKQVAYRSRDHVFRQITLLHLEHFDRGDGACRCGTPFDECYTGQVLDELRALKNWERHHAERRRRGLPHALPPRHPGIVDARWDPDQEDDDYEDEHFEEGWDDQPTLGGSGGY